MNEEHCVILTLQTLQLIMPLLSPRPSHKMSNHKQSHFYTVEVGDTRYISTAPQTFPEQNNPECKNPECKNLKKHKNPESGAKLGEGERD